MRHNNRSNKSVCQGVAAALLACGALLLLSGCAPSLAHIGAFSDASTAVVAHAAEGFKQMDQSTVWRKMSDIAADPELSPTEETFSGLLQENERLQVRLEALAKMGDYFNALGQLAAADFRKDFDRAAKDLYGALAGLRTTYIRATGQELSISNDDLSAISHAIEAIGRTMMEWERCDVIKRVVVKADPAVQQVCALVQSELDEFSREAGMNLFSVEADMIAAYKAEAGKLSFSQRLARLEKIKQQHDQAANAGRFFRQVSDAAQKMCAAHAALKAAVEKNKFYNAQLALQIGELSGLAAAMEDLHKIQSE